MLLRTYLFHVRGQIQSRPCEHILHAVERDPELAEGGDLFVVCERVLGVCTQESLKLNL